MSAHVIDDDLVLLQSAKGICEAYNAILNVAQSKQECEAVVLIHDDVYIYDRNFRAKIIAEFNAAPRTGILGVVGARKIHSLAWWESPEKAGQVFETRGFINFGVTRAFVDIVDGLFLAISRPIFCHQKFDSIAFPAYHGYDVDYCLQAREAGYDCQVIPMEILHKTKGGLGDESSFRNANSRLADKWKNSQVFSSRA